MEMPRWSVPSHKSKYHITIAAWLACGKKEKKQQIAKMLEAYWLYSVG